HKAHRASGSWRRPMRWSAWCRAKPRESGCSQRLRELSGVPIDLRRSTGGTLGGWESNALPPPEQTARGRHEEREDGSRQKFVCEKASAKEASSQERSGKKAAPKRAANKAPFDHSQRHCAVSGVIRLGARPPSP